MRMRILLKLRMRSTWLRMPIINLVELFEHLRQNGKKTEFIPARPDHQNVKKKQKIFPSEKFKFFLLKNLTSCFGIETESWHYILTLCSKFLLKITVFYFFCTYFFMFLKNPNTFATLVYARHVDHHNSLYVMYEGYVLIR